ncbi:MAG TPA: DNA repair protein RecN [Gammaproteobacteria bacterium]|nr:DNA repair protein RecN [Gammaproteobacteria bacterium]
MLTHIHIRDFAIVEELSLDFQDGMSVLTGETGAGKSILLDALNLALGDRADTGNIRYGADRAEISVTFLIDKNSSAMNWLNEQSLDQGDECLIRRVISNEGRSKGFINGCPAPMQSLRELGEILVDIHGQHEHQSLLKTDIQRQLLDEYAGSQGILQELKNLYRLWSAKTGQLDSLKQTASDRQSRMDLLNYQVGELDKLALEESELPELAEEQGRLANAERLRSTAMQYLYELYESEQNSVHQSLSHAIRSLEEISALDPTLKNIVEMLNSAAVQIQESSSELQNYIDNIALDPDRLDQVDERLGLIHDLSRKHNVIPEQLSNLHQNLENELTILGQANDDLGSLAKELEELALQYQARATQLTKLRQKAAAVLNKTVTETIRKLGMPSIEFEIAFNHTDSAKPGINGNEAIEFMISPNPGQPQKPLRKIASGGELSRISLAIQTILADSTHIPTLIYDEVDTGIGGPTAEVVGKKLRHLGNNRQVLCVTHLAQVAAQAHQHLMVSKQSDQQSTTSTVTILSGEQRIEETARMLGGLDITEQGLSHAKEMIEHAQKEQKKPARSSRKCV